MSSGIFSKRIAQGHLSPHKIELVRLQGLQFRSDQAQDVNTCRNRRPLHWTTICMAKPSKKGPETTVKVFCAGCKQYLYKYRKGGTGNLVKCFIERIVEDTTGGKLECPGCGVQFARSAMIRGRPANKIVGGKVFFQK